MIEGKFTWLLICLLCCTTVVWVSGRSNNIQTFPVAETSLCETNLIHSGQWKKSDAEIKAADVCVSYFIVFLCTFVSKNGCNCPTAVPAEGNGDLQTLICALVARPRRCLTLSNPIPWQNWMAAYLGYTLRMRTLFRGWPIMVHDTHTRRRIQTTTTMATTTTTV